MSNYPIRTISSAPEKSKSALEQLQKAFGLYRTSPLPSRIRPKLINSLVGRVSAGHGSSLTEPENQIVLLTDAVANSSPYAVAFHTALALQQGISSEETAAIREGHAPTNKRFAALSTLAKTLIEKRGHLSDQELDSFITAGFTKEQVLEVIAIVAASTITNYAGTIANPPLEDPFRQYAWRGYKRRTASPDIAAHAASVASVLTGGDRNGNAICLHGSSARRVVALLETGARQKPARSLARYRDLTAPFELCRKRAERPKSGFSIHRFRCLEHSTPRKECSAACVRICSSVPRTKYGCRADGGRNAGHRPDASSA